MPSTRKILRVFLASPSDLPEERRAVHSAVTEFNQTLAHTFGYQIELFGWEDTVSRYGRPQQIINHEVDRCDVFLGMLWKRWGTPSDTEGTHSSGFEEEFQRSIDRRQCTNSPEISLFFKNIEHDLTKDPGAQLQKVLDFRNRIIRQKSLLFENFDTSQDMERLARRCFIDYVTRLGASESVEASQPSVVSLDTQGETTRHEPKRHQVSPDSDEAFAFLESIVDRIRQEGDIDDLNALDVARLRLLSNSITQPGNHEASMGPHDLNILFCAHAQGTVYRSREIACLARMGLKYMVNENVPFWCWYSRFRKLQPNMDIALFSSALSTNEDEQLSAIGILTSIGKDLPDNDDILGRNKIIDRWLSKSASSRIKSAALRYLAKYGTSDDYAHAENEYANEDQTTSRAAIECMAAILLRHSPPNSAQRLILQTQFESLDDRMLDAVLAGFEGLHSEELSTGLQHRSTTVLRRTLEILLDRGVVADQDIERLLEHTDTSVRWRAIRALVGRGRRFAIDDVKQIMLKNQSSSTAAQAIIDRYVFDELKGLPESQLTSKIDNSLIFEAEPYFARAEKYFRKYATELRNDVDDRFGRYFEQRIERMEQLFLNSMSTSIRSMIDGVLESEHRYRQILTRKGLDILCRVSKFTDLDRIAKNLHDSYVGLSVADAEYFELHGKWTYIPLLIEAGKLSSSSLSWYERHDERDRAVAKSILRMSRGGSLDRLLSLDIPGSILTRVIELCSDSRFATISPDGFMKLFHHESVNGRRAAAIKSAKIFPAKRIRSMLDRYIDSGRYYYNVIHWLDVGASMSRSEARNVLRAAIE